MGAGGGRGDVGAASAAGGARARGLGRGGLGPRGLRVQYPRAEKEGAADREGPDAGAFWAGRAAGLRRSPGHPGGSARLPA